MPPSRRRTNRRVLTFAIASLALLLTVLLQQPAASPGRPPGAVPDTRSAADTPAPADDSSIPRLEAQAESAAQIVRRDHSVEDVVVATRDGVAIIGIRPRPGMTAEDHRTLERRIARQLTEQMDGLAEAMVTTDTAAYDQIRRLHQTREDLQRRVGPRMVESHLLWVREFDTVARQVEQIPHAREPSAAALAD